MATAVKKPAGKSGGKSPGAGRVARSEKSPVKPVKAAKAAAPASGCVSEPKPVRHFLVDQDLYAQARAHADALGLQLSSVVVSGLAGFVGQPKSRGKNTGSGVPKDVVDTLRKVSVSGDADGLSGYLMALADAGWPMAELAGVLPAHTVPARVYKARAAKDGKPARAEKVMPERNDVPTRQSVALRVKQARDKGLTPPKGAVVPVSPTGPALPRAPKDSGGFKKDLMVRVATGGYTAARERAQAEGVPMTMVIRRVLTSFVEDTAAKGIGKAS